MIGASAIGAQRPRLRLRLAKLTTMSTTLGEVEIGQQVAGALIISFPLILG